MFHLLVRPRGNDLSNRIDGHVYHPLSVGRTASRRRITCLLSSYEVMRAEGTPVARRILIRVFLPRFSSPSGKSERFSSFGAVFHFFCQ